ncbi:YgaP-like transmembrane domain [Nitrosococcus wardiae]|uniref:DUF2892 domain-containing protein n=1 Tax=Nitrosococcus wardiae TaxID=1814290 RepID=A0A4V1AVR6_9GAMM|nr:YgaP-like transmembrane domain [Nitrosococcus wardiae]QBQ54065.1 DUF2892 domain-containing protein [Nitrosococcus wardiae]
MTISSTYTPASSHAIRVPVEESSAVNVGQTERLLSTFGGGFLAYKGLQARSKGGILLTLMGGALIYRGITGHCPAYQSLNIDTSEPEEKISPIEIHETLTINKPRAEVYEFWNHLENLPQVMHHLQSVTTTTDKYSHWVARAPKGLTTLEWDAEIIEVRENELIAWQSLPDADVNNAGIIRFQDAPGGRGTEVHINIIYRPPASVIGTALARLLNPITSQVIKEDIRRFKSLMETGEIPTTEGQPQGGNL